MVQDKGGTDETPQANSTKASMSGARRGLGLALVRQLTEKLGGTVSARNDEGAVFTVVLPRHHLARTGDGP
jgi:sensor histidine kinase regulating citrate/malate metabolism